MQIYALQQNNKHKLLKTVNIIFYFLLSVQWKYMCQVVLQTECFKKRGVINISSTA